MTIPFDAGIRLRSPRIPPVNAQQYHTAVRWIARGTVTVGGGACSWARSHARSNRLCQWQRRKTALESAKTWTRVSSFYRSLASQDPFNTFQSLLRFQGPLPHVLTTPERHRRAARACLSLRRNQVLAAAPAKLWRKVMRRGYCAMMDGSKQAFFFVSVLFFWWGMKWRGRRIIVYLHDLRYLRTCVFECVCVGGCAPACVCVCVYVHRRARAS